MDKSILTPQEEKALQKFKKGVQKICGSSGWEIRIFGSRARGEGHGESDVDVLVLLSELSGVQKVQIWDEAYSVFAQTDILISPVVLSYQRYDNLKKRERLIVQNIEREGFVL